MVLTYIEHVFAFRLARTNLRIEQYIYIDRLVISHSPTCASLVSRWLSIHKQSQAHTTADAERIIAKMEITAIAVRGSCRRGPACAGTTQQQTTDDRCESWKYSAAEDIKSFAWAVKLCHNAQGRGNPPNPSSSLSGHLLCQLHTWT